MFLTAYKQFLTKNERNKVFLRKNSLESRRVADNKLKTKKVLAKKKVAVPKLIAKIRNIEELANFDWERLNEGNFVIKPSSGYGGDGILVFRKRAGKEQAWRRMDGEKMGVEEIRRHMEAILSGGYSIHGMPDKVIVEERVKIHPMFLALTKWGTPDIRVIVYNKVPLMAMLRVPTEESKGKANLQQGAVGLGVDMATGITTFGVAGKSEPIKRLWDYKKKKLIKVNGIKIPFWREILETAIKSQEAITGLGFLGVDIVLDKDEGPEVLEVNARPGLSIQICNKAGLKARINKVEELDVKSVDHGIKLAKYLFGEGFFEKVDVKEKNRMVDPIEIIRMKIPKGFRPQLQKSPVIKQGKHRVVEVRAKVDTGAYRSSIDRSLAERLGLLDKDRVLYYRHYRSSLGKHNDRPVIGVSFWVRGKRVVTAVNVADRGKLRTKFLLGRRDLGGFLVRAVKEEKSKVKDERSKLRKKKIKKKLEVT